mmetsp:Transcript_21526/g.59701  ORF Transcript_21526/g.59701 Transcript_21526/m.59701 type:complete len:304 (+) Transcript_21526:961-1872(+)
MRINPGSQASDALLEGARRHGGVATRLERRRGRAQLSELVLGHLALAALAQHPVEPAGQGALLQVRGLVVWHSIGIHLGPRLQPSEPLLPAFWSLNCSLPLFEPLWHPRHSLQPCQVPLLEGPVPVPFPYVVEPLRQGPFLCPLGPPLGQPSVRRHPRLQLLAHLLPSPPAIPTRQPRRHAGHSAQLLQLLFSQLAPLVPLLQLAERLGQRGLAFVLGEPLGQPAIVLLGPATQVRHPQVKQLQGVFIEALPEAIEHQRDKHFCLVHLNGMLLWHVVVQRDAEPVRLARAGLREPLPGRHDVQ